MTVPSNVQPVVAAGQIAPDGAPTGRVGRSSVSIAMRAALWTVLAAFVVAVAVVAVSLVDARGQVLPGVRVADVPVGGLTEAAAVEQVRARIDTLATQPVTLTIGDQSWTASPEELGITYDAPGSVDAALAFGREHDYARGFLHATRLDQRPVTVPLGISFDGAAFDAFLDHVDTQIATTPEDAAVSIDGLAVTVAPSTDGVMVDRAVARTAVLEHITSLDTLTIALPTTARQAAISTEDANAAKDVIDRGLAAPFTLTLDSEVWSVAPEELAPAVRAHPSGDGTLAVTLDRAGLDTIVAGIATQVDGPPTDARVEDMGTHQRLVPSREGRAVDREKLGEALRQAFADGEHVVGLPVTETTAPKVTTEAVMTELGITGVVATGESNFDGSGTGRAHNVVQATKMIDGTLVPPGGTFSFNQAVGSLFSGEYLEAGSFIDGPAGQSLAGGVCQVSTTVFRAALETGMPVVEWWPHLYRSPYYEQGGWSAGFDASITQNGGLPEADTDFKFVNTTGAWLLIRTHLSEGGDLKVELHGVDAGVTVKLDEPIIEVIEPAPREVDVVVDANLPPGTVLPDQPAMDGLQVTVVRHVYDATGQEIATDSFVSTYGATGPIRRVSPDMERAQGGE
ncbi:MAG TPA: peptidoglycan binding domain-containing protein [Thermomicrobiales bacterium]|nr:peptidoglycan binding domain-containing protein [Thermomicrobiales bacterium]